MQALSLMSGGFQALATLGGSKKVATKNNYVLARRWNAVSLGSVTADFGIKYFQQPTNANLAGLLNFGTITARSLLILGLDLDDKNAAHVRLQKQISMSAFVVGASLALGGQFLAKRSFDPLLAIDPKTLFPLVSLAIGCVADATNDMVSKRRLFLIMGCCTMPFALMTSAFGLAGKNLTDIGSSLYYMAKHKDPLPSMRPLLWRVRHAFNRLDT